MEPDSTTMQTLVSSSDFYVKNLWKHPFKRAHKNIKVIYRFILVKACTCIIIDLKATVQMFFDYKLFFINDNDVKY